MGSFSIWHWLIVGVVLLLVFGLRRSGTAPRTLDDGLQSSWALALPRGDEDTYSRAERLRNDLERRFRAALPASVDLTTYASAPGSGAVWLRIELMQLDSTRRELTLRTVLAVTVERFDLHRFEHVLRLELGRGLYRRTVEGLTELRDEDIRALMAFGAGTHARFPSLRSARLRRFGWQLWRPINKIQRLRRDWPAALASAAGWLALMVGAAVLIQQAMLDTDTESCIVYDRCPTFDNGILLVLGGLAVLIVRGLVLRQRRTFVLNTGKPRDDPRALVRMDSWQVTITGLGERRQAVLQSILASLQQSRPPDVAIRAEQIGYASVDAKVEREQQVLAFRRAMAFVRLEAYGSDLYVGWDSHVNGGVWQEEDIGSGVDRISGQPVVARRVVQGWNAPSEYDLSDASFLAEWLHSSIVAVIKQQLAEHRIDQEIDFTIQRESRADALRTTRPGDDKKKARTGLGAAFRRTA